MEAETCVSVGLQHHHDLCPPEACEPLLSLAAKAQLCTDSSRLVVYLWSAVGDFAFTLECRNTEISGLVGLGFDCDSGEKAAFHWAGLFLTLESLLPLLCSPWDFSLKWFTPPSPPFKEALSILQRPLPTNARSHRKLILST